jgi:hypothetical protein
MSDIKLSIIVPVYRKDSIIEKCVKSILAQSLKEYELIFVLDGPQPVAKEIIAKLTKKAKVPVKIVEIEHGGACKARNEGQRHARGAYWVHLDADVVVEPDTAKTWVDQLDKNPDVDFIYSGYKFLGENGALNSEPFDPWLLRVRNYISGCFPIRAAKCPKWDESLKSLQDWSFWLTAVESGCKGKFMQGYAWSTPLPDAESISGKGCTPEVWLERMDAVKKLHNIPIREVCVTSLHDKMDGISLAKSLGADYDDHPNDKPNHYKTIIQIGFSFKPGEAERCASAWGEQHQKVLFWTADDVEAIYDTVSLRALEQYSERLNLIAVQYVEDLAAKKIMERAGFKVNVLSLPVTGGEVAPLPEKPKFLVDVAANYGHVFNAIIRSIPDISLEKADGVQSVDDYTGLVTFRQDRLLRSGVKRALAAGRHVISNIQSPFAGFVEDKTSDAAFIKAFVNKIRETARKPQSKEAASYWTDPKKVSKILEVVK